MAYPASKRCRASEWGRPLAADNEEQPNGCRYCLTGWARQLKAFYEFDLGCASCSFVSPSCRDVSAVFLSVTIVQCSRCRHAEMRTATIRPRNGRLADCLVLASHGFRDRGLVHAGAHSSFAVQPAGSRDSFSFPPLFLLFPTLLPCLWCMTGVITSAKFRTQASVTDYAAAHRYCCLTTLLQSQ